MGIAASGNIHPGKVSMFEPIHGSAPKYKGQNKANPLATVMALSLMLDHVGEAEAAQGVEDAVADLIQSGKVSSLQAGAYPCSDLGDWVRDGVLAKGR